MGFLDKIGIKVNKDDKPKEDSIVPKSAAEIAAAPQEPIDNSQISETGKMVIDVDLPDDLKNGPTPPSMPKASEIPPMGEIPSAPTLTPTPASQPQTAPELPIQESYEGSFKLPDYDNLSSPPVQHQISSDIDHQDFGIRNSDGVTPTSSVEQKTQIDNFVPPLNSQPTVESSLPNLDTTPVDITKPIPSISEAMGETQVSEQNLEFPEIAPPEPIQEDPVTPEIPVQNTVPPVSDYSNIQNNYIPQEVQERIETQTAPMPGTQIPQAQPIPPPQNFQQQPQPPQPQFVQKPQISEQVFSRPPAGMVVPQPKPQIPEKHLYMSVGNFKKLVEIVNAVGSEIRVASDAVLRVEEINSDSQSLYDDWKTSLDEMENIIIKFDKSLFNIKG